MPTSKPTQNYPLPAGNHSSSYTRFIPREELGSFSAWHPDSLQTPGQSVQAPGQSSAGGGVHKPSLSERADAQVASSNAKAASKLGKGKQLPPESTAVGATMSANNDEKTLSVENKIKEARQAGYQDGYRDGLVALDGFKQTQAAQMAAFLSEHVGAVVSEMHIRLELIEQDLSARIAGVAVELAKQVVRSEISLRPELVISVAHEALSTLLETAKHITLRMNPQDLQLTNGLLEDLLSVRGAKVVSDSNLLAGGCVVESDIATVDASIQSRWQNAASAMGLNNFWSDKSEKHDSLLVEGMNAIYKASEKEDVS